jgi:hypothetical protein
MSKNGLNSAEKARPTNKLARKVAARPRKKDADMPGRPGAKVSFTRMI